MQAPLYVGIDVGGTSIKAGVVDALGQLVTRGGESTEVPTDVHRGQAHGLEQMAKAVREAASQADVRLDEIRAIGVATPGTMDIHRGLMLDPPNFKGWKNVPVRDFVRDRFQKDVAFQNDANAAAFGEHWVGSGRGVKNLVLLTLGTGIGCGIVLDGRIIEGATSHGGEVGHIIISLTTDRECGCGQFGHLEAYASVTAMLARADEMLKTAGPLTQLGGLFAHPDYGRKPAAVFKAAAEYCPIAERLVLEIAYYLAVGAVNMIHTVDPEIVLFGGGMSEAGGPSFLERIRAQIRRLAFPTPGRSCRVEYATLGNKAGFIGAAGWAKHLFPK